MRNIFSTNNSIMVNKYILYTLKKRNKKDEGKRIVEVSEDIHN